VIGTSSDTVNSLQSPATANSLFSFRPTIGLISCTGVAPIFFTQDIVGAIGPVADIAKILTVMASVWYDPDDNVTALIPPSSVGIDYSTGSCSVVDCLGYWDHRCISRVKVLTTLVMALLTGCIRRWGVGAWLKNPSIRPNRMPERLLPHTSPQTLTYHRTNTAKCSQHVSSAHRSRGSTQS